MTKTELVALVESTPPEHRTQLVDAMCDRAGLPSDARTVMHELVRAISALDELERQQGGTFPLDDMLAEDLADLKRAAPKRRTRS